MRKASAIRRVCVISTGRSIATVRLTLCSLFVSVRQNSFLRLSELFLKFVHQFSSYELTRDRHTDGQTDGQDTSCGLLGRLNMCVRCGRSSRECAVDRHLTAAAASSVLFGLDSERQVVADAECCTASYHRHHAHLSTSRVTSSQHYQHPARLMTYAAPVSLQARHRTTGFNAACLPDFGKQ